jgi:DNA-binding transcriptional MerR regulator/methylmalonyl-CoA mutase cobalamin-binding subunit
MQTGDEREGMRIAAVSRLLGVPVPTIRSWERRYGFPAPPRTDGRHRRYGSVELEQLRALRDLVTKGHSTRDAVALVRRSTLAGSQEGSPAEQALNAVLASDGDLLRAELDATTERLGVEDTIRRVILPAMHEIGSRWRVGRCDVGREHLATEVVRSWLARQAFLAPQPFRPRPIVLASGPQDLHTIGLEAFAVILARRGWRCRVLGARTPTEALVAMVQSLDAVAAVVTAQRAVTRRSAVGSIDAAHDLPGVRAFYAGDGFAAPKARKDVGGIYLGENLVEAAVIIEESTSMLRRPRVQKGTPS